MRIYDREGNYSREEILAALEAVGGSTRSVRFRYVVLSASGAILGDVSTSVLSCEVEHNAFGEVKRTAKLTLRDDTSINFLSDRIQPWMQVDMPKSTVPTPGEIVARNLWPDPTPSGTGRFLAQAGNTQSPTPDGPGVRYTKSGSGAGQLGGSNTTLSNLAPLEVGKTYTFAFEARPSETTTLAVQANLRNSGGQAATPYGEGVPCPAGAWTWVTFAVEIPEGITGGGPRIQDLSPALPAGAYVDARNFGVLEGTRRVFSGRDKNDSVLGGYAYSWEGAVDNSTSLARLLVPGPDTRPGFVEWPLGVFLLSTPNRNISPAGVVTREVDGFDRTLELREDRLPARYTIAAGTGYTAAVGVLLAGRYDLRLTPSTKTLPVAMEWEPGTSRLAILNDLLGAINYAGAYFDEDGALVAEPYIAPSDRPSEYTYATDERSVILPSIDQGIDLFEVANDFVLVVSEADRPPLMARYTNAAPNSPTSTVNRGRTITDFRDGIEAADQATLDALASRIAFEASQVYETVDFATALMPLHGHADVYTLSVGGLVIGSKFAETSWKMELRAGGVMEHSVRRVVSV